MEAEKSFPTLVNQGAEVGLYTGRLRNNSERCKRSARKKDKLERPSRPKARGNQTPARGRSKSLKLPTHTAERTKEADNTTGIWQFLVNSNPNKDCNSCANTTPSPITPDKAVNYKPNMSQSQSDKGRTNWQQNRSDKSNSHTADQTETDKDNATVNNTTTPTNDIRNPPQGQPPEVITPQNSNMMSEEEKQIIADEETLAKLEQRLTNLSEGSMEKMLLEMQLDTKRDNVKTCKTMCAMFRSSLSTLNGIDNLSDKCATLSNTVQNLKTSQEDQSTDINNLENNLDKVCKEVLILTSIVQRQAMMIKHLQEVNEESERKKLKNNIIIQSLEVGSNDSEQDIKDLVNNFFSQTMKIRKNIAIRSVMQLQRTGHAQPSAIQVTLNNIRDKGLIFKNIKKIIDVKNNNDDNYYVNDQLTFEKQEEQRRFRAIKKANSELTPTDRASISFKRGELYINNEKYMKKIKFPKVCDTIYPESEEKINKLYMTEGEYVTNEGCRFVTISLEISTWDDIRCGYIKARRSHPKALHVVCAFSLPGSINPCNKDFYDCGEHGAGRTLLDLLTKNNINNRAIFVVRYYRGAKQQI